MHRPSLQPRNGSMSCRNRYAALPFTWQWEQNAPARHIFPAAKPLRSHRTRRFYPLKIHVHIPSYHIRKLAGTPKYAFGVSKLPVAVLSHVPARKFGIVLPRRRNHTGTVTGIFTLPATAAVMITVFFLTAAATFLFTTAAMLFFTAAATLFFTLAALRPSAVSPAGITSSRTHTTAASPARHLSLHPATAPFRPAATAGITAAAVSPAAAIQKQ